MNARRALAMLAALLPAPVALAHGQEAVAPGWSFEAWVVGPALVALAWFALGAWRLRRRGAAGGVARRREALFLAGWAALTLALVSPLHAAGARSFSAHMLEHEVLMLLAAPLLVLSRPVGVALWALPRRARRALARAGRATPWALAWRALTSVPVATALQAVALWAWHAPALFGLALAHTGWHVAQHASFLATALLFWHAVWRPGRRAAGATVLALFATATTSGALGAFMALARSPWYAGYAALGLAPLGLTPLEDQQLAGLLMWVPGGLVHAGAALWLLARQLRPAPAWREVGDAR